MRRLCLLALACAAACGDNLLGAGAPLAPAHDLVIVAHQDDDLLFMQPDLLEAIRGGAGVTTVYVTAGNGTHGAAVAELRYEGLRAAYGEAAGAHDWRCGWIELAHHAAQHCRLSAANVSLVFLAYPDGGKQGEQPASLRHLWEGASTGADTVADRVAHYDRDGLIDALAAAIEATGPATIHTLEIAGTHGRDHADHVAAGALALLAAAHAGSTAELVSYRGYDIEDEPANKLDAVYAEAVDMVGRYEAVVSDCGRGGACPPPDAHATWLARRYAVGFRARAAGRLRAGATCLADAATGAVTLAACAGAPSWRLEGGALREGARCLAAGDGGALAMAECDGDPGERWFLDDEGHLWSGAPPPPIADASYTHLLCLAPGDAGPRAVPCGAGGAPAWGFQPAAAVTPRAALGLAATGRAVRIGDLTGDGRGDLCAVEAGGLRCAPGDGAGGFSAASRIDDPAAPLAIDPASLVIGDVDGDGRADACGRAAGGLVCALAAHGFAAAPWSAAFSDADARAGTSASLAALDADGDGVPEICGLVAEGVICAPRGLGAAHPAVRSAWPAADAPVWLADLDGDGRADWCAATAAGTACGVAAEADVSTDGAPWSFSLAGQVDPVPGDPGAVAFGDVDGTGRAALCTLDGARVACARSSGRGFGPRATLALLPDGAAPTALWLGDLDGDGRADACTDTGATVTCVRAP